ncbi:bifunctional folylpolyglutamate synthase/dihydrofolate synthase [Carnobacterium maltaromaticum]|uniref:bifunctional folylpolyglutamate synthase/dihydrofolate synthase n=1 Tax=Carnobacterium maltaromaticum TaxID=2751 RepID=UPI000C78E91A|nr:folylpolyglutamate synthase/dihydrofolate synthase family protein [Carnobacterium maltaromaticum]PLS38337.1 bifunctional folylpolyglutamate synthase/dihydrofolate synthase [Carnobacterium maltaromaticum]PLS38714.1 bifunctional folylpolyglutamate synthase/dihydrofolate synthase [Carnobacterium maltaromaticum]PLS39091.1 bifunctional folylpolyglutamate synthase/dihydrofolate synthase [Carnobacterium maltaromaticum]PLS45361.1 bifunctional folylpolyglutamate synthase/dihydrofolate synthase [Carno
MFKTYEEALEWIHGRLVMGMKPGLKRMEWMMKRLGHPERRFKSIHVAGTNGKGSTVTYLRGMLEAAGQVVGTFTSPYITTFNERISVNGEPISNEEILRLANLVYPLVMELEETSLGGPSEFEVVNTMMFIYFGEGHADVVLIEVGLGGLVDSTNVVTPVVSAITTIGLDHMHILGGTIAEIAEQKAGIIKPGIPVVVGNVDSEALKVITKVAEENASPLLCFNQDYFISKWKTLPTWGETFTFEDDFICLRQVVLSMLGKHQVENAALALEVLRVYSHETGLAIGHEQMLRGLKASFWPGRLEKINEDPLIILDGAHNEPAMNRLVETLKNDFEQQEIYVLFAALGDKAVDKMLGQLQVLPNVHLILTSFYYPRAASANQLTTNLTGNYAVEEVWQEGLVKTVNEMDSNSVLIITGSLYFISEVRHYFLDETNN